VPAITPEQVASGIVWAVEHNRREHVLPAMLRFFFMLHRLAPGPVEALLARTGWQRPARAAAKGTAET
jgi:hypothetical protein